MRVEVHGLKEADAAVDGDELALEEGREREYRGEGRHRGSGGGGLYPKIAVYAQIGRSLASMVSPAKWNT